MVEGGNSPVDDAGELKELGYRIALYPAALLHSFVPRAQRLLATLRNTGTTRSLRQDMIELGEISRLLGAGELLDSGKRYDSED